ncbi:MAG: hypothetical protein V1921_06290 [Candidatus Altiarchaeota archaeon]
MTGTKIVKLRLDGGGQAERLPVLKNNLITTEEALRLYKDVRFQHEFADDRTKYYERIMEELKGTDVMPEQLQEIYDAMSGDFRSDTRNIPKTGLMVSALVQNSSRNDFSLKIGDFIPFLGFKLGKGKKLTVDGDVGDFTGELMDGGTVHVLGEAGWRTGAWMKDGKIIVGLSTNSYTGWKMEGGEIIVEDDVTSYLGSEMKAGRVHVKGSAGSEVGDKMEGGTVEVDGGAQNVSANYKSGTIILQGLQVKP